MATFAAPKGAAEREPARLASRTADSDDRAAEAVPAAWVALSQHVSLPAAAAGEGDPGPPAAVQKKCDGCAPTAPCDQCRSEQLQRKARHGSAESGPPPAALVPTTAGRPLDDSTRAYFEPHFGHDFSGVRVHTCEAAAHSARAVHAEAYTTGPHIVFAESRFRPGTPEGDRLLAHELAHVVQQQKSVTTSQAAGIASDSHEREADRAADAVIRGGAAGSLSPVRAPAPQHKDEDLPPEATVLATLDVWAFDLKSAATFKPGPTDVQVMDIVLRALLGPKWKPTLAPAIVRLVKDSGIIESGDPVWTNVPEVAAGGESIPPKTTLYSWAVKEIVEELVRQGSPVALPPRQQELLDLGGGAAQTLIFDVSGGTGLPRWYTDSLLVKMLATRGTLLRAYAKELSAAIASIGTPKAAEAFERRHLAATAVVDSLKPPALVLDAIRKDSSLTSHAVYKMLWPALPAKPGEPSPTTPQVAAEDRPPRLETAVGILSYIETQPELAANAVGADPAEAPTARRELLDRFERYLGWRPALVTKGTQPLTDIMTLPNMEAYPATLSAYPPIEPPLFDASTVGEYGFTMALQFPTIWSAFQIYYYKFDRIRVPNEEVIGAEQRIKAQRIEELPAQEASEWQMLKTRLAKDTRYNEADLRRLLGDFRVMFGAPGTSVEALTINALLRYAGSIISTGIKAVADPAYLARFSFPEEGLYILRALASPAYFGGTPEAYREDSVAYLPVFARSPEVLAEQSVQAQLDEQATARKRLIEIVQELQDDPYADVKSLTEEQKRLNAVLGDVGTLLSYQKAQIAERLADTKNPPSATERQALEARQKKIDELEGRRAERGLDALAERLPTAFVADTGQRYVLLIEARKQETDPNAPDQETWQVVDSTTKSGSMETATGKDRPSALRSALRALLEKGGYGRGVVTVNIGKEVFTMRVEASSTALLKEAAGNVALVLSIAAVAAAPFTGGSSLVLLIPAGIIGAIPSVFRIIERNIDKTFEWDLETAMDIVNIVGAVIGLGAEAQLVKRSLWVGRALMIAGVGTAGAGVVVMGAGLMEQVKALDDLPAAMRSAALLEILGNAMLQAGIMVGGIVMSTSRMGATEKFLAGKRTDFRGWLESLNEDTRKAVTENPKALAAYKAMKPLVRELLTLCGSLCVRIDPPPTPHEQLLIEAVAGKLDASGQRWLQGMIHDNRAQLAERLAPLAKMTDPAAILAVLKGFTDEAGAVLLAFSPEFKTPELRAKAAAVVKAGDIPIERIGRVLDKVRMQKGGDPMAMLGYLEELGSRKPPGWERVLTDLETGGGMHKGARWVLEFLTSSKLWDKLQAFEVEAEPGGRRWDFRVGDVLYQLKSWSYFWEATFTRQILQDHLKTGGFTSAKVRWVFELTGLGQAADIVKMMTDALDRAAVARPDVYKPEIVDAIKKALPGMVQVGVNTP